VSLWWPANLLNNSVVLAAPPLSKRLSLSRLASTLLGQKTESVKPARANHIGAVAGIVGISTTHPTSTRPQTDKPAITNFSVSAPIDTGATHNSTPRKKVKAGGLTPVKNLSSAVSLINGDTLLIHGIFRETLRIMEANGEERLQSLTFL
jgi:hypothetical protein